MSALTLSTVDTEGMSGKRVFFDQVGAVRMQPKVGRAVDIPVVNTPHARRSVTAKDFYIRDFIDEFDKLKILNDPTNSYTVSFSAAAARECDKVLIDAALGTAYTGEEGTTSVALPSAQKIAAGSTGFTLTKLKNAVKKLKTANAMMPGDSVHVFWTAYQEHEFMDSSEVKSFDFNTQKVLSKGSVEDFFGVQFHRIEDVSTSERILPLVSTTRSCVMWLKSGMKFGTWKAPYGRVAWLDERESYQVMAGMSVGATRMQEVKVVQIDCVES